MHEGFPGKPLWAVTNCFDRFLPLLSHESRPMAPNSANVTISPHTAIILLGPGTGSTLPLRKYLVPNIFSALMHTNTAHWPKFGLVDIKINILEMIATISVLLTSPWYFQIWGLRDKVWWTTVGGPGRRPCRGRPQGRARGSRWGPGPATSSPPPATGATGAGTETEAAQDTGEWDRQWGHLNKQGVNGPGGHSVPSLHNC